MTELDIINDMLASVLEQPVSSVANLHPSVVTARNTLAMMNMRCQAEGNGWWFNKEFNYPLTPAADKRIVLPENTLFVDATDSRKRYVQRGRYLYDIFNHTDQFDSNIKVTITFLLPISDLPQVAASYVSAAAVHAFFTNEDGEGTKAAKYAQDVLYTRAVLRTQSITILGLSTYRSPMSAMTFGRGMPGRIAVTSPEE